MSVLVQKEAPSFTAAAIMPDNAIDESFSLQKYRGRYVVLFFYPLDFTFVCPSEILAFDHRLDDFRKRDCEVIGISVDYAIHHMTRFDLEFRRRGSYHEALFASMADVGRALVITSVVLVLGFLVFYFSALDSMASFGSLLAGTVATALVADFLLMPALVMTLKPFGPERPR